MGRRAPLARQARAHSYLLGLAPPLPLPVYHVCVRAWGCEWGCVGHDEAGDGRLDIHCLKGALVPPDRRAQRVDNEFLRPVVMSVCASMRAVLSANARYAVVCVSGVCVVAFLPARVLGAVCAVPNLVC